MAQIWYADNEPLDWSPWPLVDDMVVLTEQGQIVNGVPGIAHDSAGTALLVRYSARNSERWALVMRQDSRIAVNGTTLATGIHDLLDKDEILFSEPEGSARRLYFSTERLARIEPFPDGITATCPRCRKPLKPGDASVRCPMCSVFHHQGQTECWLYEEFCAACLNQKTAFDQGFRWTPEEL